MPVAGLFCGVPRMVYWNVLAAKLEIVDIPILYCMVLDPDKNGLNAPNMVGILLEVPIERQFKEMRLILPAVKRIGVL